MSPQDTVVFQSEANDSSQVRLHFEPSSYVNNYVVRLNGADYVTFKDMTLQNTDTYYGHTIELDSGAHHNNFINLSLINPVVTTSSDRMAVIHNHATYANEFNRFYNCHFKGGSIGANLDGYYNGSAGNQLLNSEFSDQYYYGIYLDDQDEYIVKNNEIHVSSSSSTSYGIYANDSYTGLIAANRVKSSRYGIWLSDFDGASSAPSTLKNNFVYVGGSNEGYGIYLNSSNDSRIVHNSVLITNTNQQSSAYRDGGNSDHQVYNNIFQNIGGGYAHEFNYSSTSGSLDYNSLFSSGAYLADWDGTYIADLTTWISTTNLDSNSVAIDANFSSNTDLHTSAASVNAAGKSLAYVTHDIDGETRDAQAPDIGADEFTPNPNDVSLTSFEGPTMPFTEGTQMVYVNLLNNGSDTLTSVIIEWRVNGVAQSSYSWTGSLPSGQVLDSIPVGNYNFGRNIFHDVKVWTKFPNSSTDADLRNDTIQATDLYPALAGVYAIGGTTPDFNNFTEAVNALQTAGVIDWVTFNLRAGDYNEKIVINSISGVSATDSILFQSEGRDSSLVSLSHNLSSDAYALKLDGAQYITFRDISFRGIQPSTAQSIFMDGPTNEIRFTRCNFWITPGYGSGVYHFNVTNKGINENITLKNCSFYNGQYGFYGYGDYSDEPGLEISNCQFINQEDRGIDLYQYDAPLLVGNSIRSANPDYGYRAMELGDLTNDFRVERNKIYLPIEGTGVYMDDCQASSAKPGLVTNNFISVTDSSDQSENALEIATVIL
ncbi:MAG: right-handed parallel beta-helix repeat-containing protein [Owenweeksia sp.]|nr:right-handed parallel beta-helix repeat-containing protein [Owenweeksia sp.]